MNLTWHIVKKDLRALKWPLLVWLLLVVAQLGVGVLLLSTDGSQDLDWFRRMDILAKMLGAMQFMSFVLTAALIQQDLLVGTTAFWQTRPISGGRLLCAKFLSIGLVFGFMPVLVTLPWWLGCGYGLREIAWAAAETVAAQTIAVLIGLLWAVVTDGFARFLMWTLVAVFTIPTLTGTLLYYTTRGQTSPSGDLVATRMMLQTTLAVVGILGVTVYQFLTRNLWRSAAMIGGTAAVIVAVGVWWPWASNIESRLNVFLLRRAVGEWPASAEPAGLKFTVGSSGITPLRNGSRPSKVSMVRTQYHVEGLVMSQGLMAASSEYAWRWPDGTEQVGRSWSRSNMMERAAEQALKHGQPGYDPNEPYTDSLVVSSSVPAAMGTKLLAEPSVYTLQARIRLMRFESVTPVPLQPGARKLQDRLGQRLAAVEKSGEQLLVTFINHAPSLLVDNAGGGVLAPFGQYDQYFLVNRKNGFVDRGSAHSRMTTRIGTVGIAWQTTGYRAAKAGGARVSLEAMNALADAELVKVSFTEQARFTHELKADPFKAEAVSP